ncbi:MAG: MarR family transcriptional regulator [Opitutae bacterium]|jgi:DNA-binding IclR family transcriptional regulator|nr:MarR family transcriptional regulator [Opitutae bacterium]
MGERSLSRFPFGEILREPRRAPDLFPALGPVADSPSHTVPVLCKAIRVLEAVAQSPADATTKSLAATLRISPTTCYRILKSFVAAGWLRPRAGGAFEISVGLVPLFRPLLRHEILLGAVREPITALVGETGLTAKLTVRQGDQAVTIHATQSPQAGAIASRVGAAVSLAIGSSGATFLGACPDTEVNRVLSAAPPEVWRLQRRADVLQRIREARRAGVCFDHGSYRAQLHTLSAPLFGAAGETVAVLTLLGSPLQLDSAVRSALVRELRQTAENCSQAARLDLPQPPHGAVIGAR